MGRPLTVPLDMREVLYLYFVEQVSLAGIGRALGVSHTTVRRYLNRHQIPERVEPGNPPPPPPKPHRPAPPVKPKRPWGSVRHAVLTMAAQRGGEMTVRDIAEACGTEYLYTWQTLRAAGVTVVPAPTGRPPGRVNQLR